MGGRIVPGRSRFRIFWWGGGRRYATCGFLTSSYCCDLRAGLVTVVLWRVKDEDSEIGY